MRTVRRIVLGTLIAAVLAVGMVRSPLKANAVFICWYTGEYRYSGGNCRYNGDNSYTCNMYGNEIRECYAFWDDTSEGGGEGTTPDPTVDPGGDPPPSTNPTPLVRILEANIVANRVVVEAGPPNANVSGLLSVVAVRDGTQSWLDGRVVGPGRHQFTMRADTLAQGQYSAVIATWEPAPDPATKTVAFYVVGSLRHTTYNTPDETYCGGAFDYITYVRGLEQGCSEWWAYEFNTRTSFETQAHINGSGVSNSGMKMQLDWRCGYESWDGMFAEVRTITGKWGQSLGDWTLAVNPNVTPELWKDDQVLIVGYGTKTVRDLCGWGCVQNTAIDNYSTQPACGGHDLLDYAASAQTIRINR